MKKILAVILLVLVAISLCACATIGTRQIGIDTAYNFKWGIIQLGNGEIIEGPVSGWRDFQDGDEIQLVINGVTYLTHYSNVILASEKP